MIYFRELGSAPLLAVSHMISHMTYSLCWPSSRLPEWNEDGAGDGSRELGAEGQRSTERQSETQGHHHTQGCPHLNTHGSSEAAEGEGVE